jgi:hypothetical protein
MFVLPTQCNGIGGRDRVVWVVSERFKVGLHPAIGIDGEIPKDSMKTESQYCSACVHFRLLNLDCLGRYRLCVDYCIGRPCALCFCLRCGCVSFGCCLWCLGMAYRNASLRPHSFLPPLSQTSQVAKVLSIGINPPNLTKLQYGRTVHLKRLLVRSHHPLKGLFKP